MHDRNKMFEQENVRININEKALTGDASTAR